MDNRRTVVGGTGNGIEFYHEIISGCQLPKFGVKIDFQKNAIYILEAKNYEFK